MRCIKHAAILVISSMVLLSIACENDEEPNATITVSSGTAPTISWSFNQALKDIADPFYGRVSEITVTTQTDESSSDVLWLVFDVDSIAAYTFPGHWDNLNGIDWPVKYGVKPSGALHAYYNKPLEFGTEYLVKIAIETIGDGDMIGERFEKKFTP